MKGYAEGKDWMVVLTNNPTNWERQSSLQPRHGSRRGPLPCMHARIKSTRQVSAAVLKCETLRNRHCGWMDRQLTRLRVFLQGLVSALMFTLRVGDTSDVFWGWVILERGRKETNSDLVETFSWATLLRSMAAFSRSGWSLLLLKTTTTTTE